MTDKAESLDDMKARARRERMEEFFEHADVYRIKAEAGDWDPTVSFTIEGLYQAFKERMIKEMEQ